MEGTDLVGKTTLCKKLLDQLNRQIGGYQYQHFTRLPEGWDYYWSYVNRMSVRLVQDRFHDSESAYCYGRGEASVFENEGARGRFRYELIEAKLALLGCVKVVVTCDETEINRRFAEKGDVMYSTDVIIRANKWFEENTERFHHHYHASGPGEFPAECEPFIKVVIDHYMVRQTALDRVLRSAPRHGL